MIYTLKNLLTHSNMMSEVVDLQFVTDIIDPTHSFLKGTLKRHMQKKLPKQKPTSSSISQEQQPLNGNVHLSMPQKLGHQVKIEAFFFQLSPENYKQMCNPQHNKTMKRHKFHTRNQKQGETVESFINDLKIKAKTLESLTDKLICDRIVCGINNNVLERPCYAIVT